MPTNWLKVMGDNTTNLISTPLDGLTMFLKCLGP